MLFALPSYQFPYLVMNRCLYLTMWLSIPPTGRGSGYVNWDEVAANLPHAVMDRDDDTSWAIKARISTQFQCFLVLNLLFHWYPEGMAMIDQGVLFFLLIFSLQLSSHPFISTVLGRHWSRCMVTVESMHHRVGLMCELSRLCKFRSICMRQVINFICVVVCFPTGRGFQIQELGSRY